MQLTMYLVHVIAYWNIMDTFYRVVFDLKIAY